MGLIYGLAYFLSFMMGIMLFTLVVHQTDVHSLLIDEVGCGEEGSALMNEINGLMITSGTTSEHSNMVHFTAPSLGFSLHCQS